MTGATSPRRSNAWRGQAFGLSVASAFPIEGSAAVASQPGLPRVELGLATRPQVSRALPPNGTSVIARRQDPAGRWVPHVRAHNRAGYLVSAPNFGLFHVSPTGGKVRCAPTPVAAWRWQRSLIGEVLPFVCALRGLETMHASAVVLPGGEGAVAITGLSGSGKSSVAAGMILGGATLLADDVVALQARGGSAIAHPAFGLMSLRHVTARRLGKRAVRRLGTTLGSDSTSIRLAMRRQEAPLALTAVYFLEPSRRAGAVRLEHISNPDPRLLLSSTFNFVLQTPTRLLAQLDALSAMAATTRMVRVRLPAGADYSAVAARVMADASAAGGVT